MSKLKVLDLFSGIGGFSLGLERTGGFETVAFCEIEEFPRKVLEKHWPEVPQYEDVRQLTGDILKRDGISVDVITGGFPCQDISVAGKQAGINENTRSGLWSEIVRLIGDIRPKYVIVENVSNLLSGPSNKRGGWFGRVLSDLAECGYDAEWENIQPKTVGLQLSRPRVWICAYPSKINVEKVVVKKRLPSEPRRMGSGHISRARWSVDLSLMGRGLDGVPDRVDRFEGLGNAVVPQIPELIGNAILAAESNAA
jgi:DNA (cytosine-5)-methyltransferase 1